MYLDRIRFLLEELMPAQKNINLKDIIEGVDLFKITESEPVLKQCYEKGIIFIFQGKKEVLHENQLLTYDANHYLILSHPSPMECRVFVSDNTPILGLRIDLNTKILNELLYDSNISFQYAHEGKPGLYTEYVTDQLLDAITRLLESLLDSQYKLLLSALYIKEILFLVLKSPHVYALNCNRYRNESYYKISQVIDNIYLNYQEKYDVYTLANHVNMSTSTFHNSFKEITGYSPIQYIKNVKLHKAKELLTTQQLPAKVAAYEVGYESLSQFNREYKRLFGTTPKGATASQ